MAGTEVYLCIMEQKLCIKLHVAEQELSYKLCVAQRDGKKMDVTKTNEPKAHHDPILYVFERNAKNDSYQSHIYGIAILQLRLSRRLNAYYPLNEHARARCRVRAEYEEPVDNEIPTNVTQAREDSNVESDDSNGEDSEMGEAAYAPTDDEQD
ncbi:hypothetical protein HAX54_013953 [Datura stramonium]|uniref:Uncharacterized protein n=1 Tax=Datura stramonium TaxID=4076 RepID=A0ABS8TP22_DATST|nr:hypothetical protein [Datura stramonium]